MPTHCWSKNGRYEDSDWPKNGCRLRQEVIMEDYDWLKYCCQLQQGVNTGISNRLFLLTTGVSWKILIKQKFHSKQYDSVHKFYEKRSKNLSIASINSSETDKKLQKDIKRQLSLEY